MLDEVRKMSGYNESSGKGVVAGKEAFALYTGVASAGRNKDKMNVCHGRISTVSEQFAGRSTHVFMRSK
jgi:hypothetical protein